MEVALWAGVVAGTASLVAWAYLTFARGWFWRTSQRLPEVPPSPPEGFRWPPVAVIIPARNEAQVLPHTLPTVLGQDYPGALRVFLVDDGSDDGTAEVARQAAREAGASQRLTVVAGGPLPSGWAGKVWALQQGYLALRQAQGAARGPDMPEFLLLTDADIAHSADSLRSLVLKAALEGLDLVSLMAQLRARSFWERLLIPAFVYYFAKLYPFAWANDPRRRTAAAAGGCVLLRREALERAGGFQPIASAIIDDCALARLIKTAGRPQGGRTWLGLAHAVGSLRAYDSLGHIWDMVARTAIVQLRYSAALVVATVAGMALVYMVPPVAALGGLALAGIGGGALALGLAGAGLAAWALMAGTYLPMLRWYSLPAWLALLMPLTALLYTLMTVDSALRYWRGKGGSWRGRAYARAP